jgi:hypothetical protein
VEDLPIAALDCAGIIRRERNSRPERVDLVHVRCVLS